MTRKKTVEPADELFQVIRFANYLEAMALDGKRGTRGERSKLRLLATGARLLDACGYQDLKIEDVAAAARLAKGTFYIYFRTKDEFLRELVQRYCDFEQQTIPRSSPAVPTYLSAREFVSWYERTFIANVGVIRCMVQMGAVDPAVRACWLLRNSRVVNESVDATLRRVRPGTVDRDMLTWVTRTSGGMLDQSLFDRYGLQTPTGRQDPYDDDTIAEMHALLIYRGLYGCDPPESEVRLARSIVTMSQHLAPRSK